MALLLGSKAPQFTLPATSELNFSLKNYLGKPLVLFFYPKDFTRGCTAESCEFRDQFEEFRDLEVLVFGISRDDIATHERFKKAHKLPYELISDVDGKVCKHYDALVPVLKIPKRVTYLLDENHQIAGVFEGFFENKAHVSAMIKKLKQGVTQK